jgi:hypothetical protein
MYFIVTVNICYNCSTREYKVTDSRLNKASKFDIQRTVHRDIIYNKNNEMHKFLNLFLE